MAVVTAFCCGLVIGALMVLDVAVLVWVAYSVRKEKADEPTTRSKTAGGASS